MNVDQKKCVDKQMGKKYNCFRSGLSVLGYLGRWIIIIFMPAAKGHKCFICQTSWLSSVIKINPLTPKLNPSSQRWLTRFLLGILLLEPCISLIYVWKTNKYTNYSFSLLIMYGSSCMFGVTLPSSGSVPSAFWEMLNWGAVDRILCVSRTTSLDRTRPPTIFYQLLLNLAPLRRD
jgi:hypothetical protein